jgi:hypothetical protein
VVLSRGTQHTYPYLGTWGSDVVIPSVCRRRRRRRRRREEEEW